MIAFVSGGARSGKSEMAERLTQRWCSQCFEGGIAGGQAVYVATASRSDEEMEARIAHHLSRRGYAWRTIELGSAKELQDKLRALAPHSVLLLDCMTIWLSRMMLEEGCMPEEIAAYWSEVLVICRSHPVHAVIVSNDLNEGMPSKDALTLAYTALLEKLHRQTIHEAKLAVQTTAGMAIYWKGEEQ